MQWTALIIIVVPKLVLHMVGPTKAGTSMSLLTASGALLASVAQPIFGALSDRLHHPWGRRRPYMLVGVILTAVMLVTMGMVHTFIWFFLAYLGLQLFANLASAPYAALIPDVVVPQQRGVASGYMGMMNQAAIILGVLIPTFITHTREMFMILAALQLLGLLVTLVGVHEMPLRDTPATWHWGRFFKSFWLSPKMYRDWWWVFLTRLLVLLGFSTLEYYLYYYLHFVQGLANPSSMLDLVLVVMTVGSLLSVLTAGWLSDKFQRRKIMVILGGIFMGITAIGFVFTKSLTMIYVFAGIFGIGYGTYLSTDWALAVDVLPRTGDAAKDMGLWSISQTIAQTIATAIGGILLVILTHRVGAAEAYRALFVVTFVYFLLGSLLVTRVRSAR